MTIESPLPPEFVHLHVHTEYSLIDGTIRTGKALAKAKSWGQTAMAITDSGNLFGAVEFYAKAKSEGIKAIIGSEIYFEGHPKTLEWAQKSKQSWPMVGAFHLVLLCKNNSGYKKLCKIVSLGYTDGLKEVPVVKTKHLHEFSGDMIALSGDLKSELSYLVRELRGIADQNAPGTELDLSATEDPTRTLTAAISDHISGMHSYVGLGNYYVELIDNRLKGQRQHLKDLVTVARHFSLPLVCSADAHYLDASFIKSHAVFVAIKASVTFKDLRGRNKQARFHLLSPNEIQSIYGEWPDSIENTCKIAALCNVSFEFGKYFLPKFSVPDGFTEGEYLAKISAEKLEERFVYLAKIYGATFDEVRRQVYRDRLTYEISVIQKMGFPGYFLIVQDFINWAKAQDIPVGPGRGSGAGSLVAYSLRITDIDPLRFNLLFERFLNPERISMPDFDVDFCQDRRGEVIDYVTAKYGKEHVAQIATFGKMKTKLAVRDIGRVMELSYGRVDKIAKLIPAKVKNEAGEDVEPTIALALKAEPKLQEESDRDSIVAEIIQTTIDLEGLNRQTGTHAAGVVMSDGPMTDYLPVFTTEEGGLITQFEMKNAEKVGLVKFDFLGLKTLTVLQWAIRLIHSTRDPDFDISLIDLEDKSVYRNISTAHTIGIFQLEGDGMMQLVKKLQPS
ncbi:MAG: DNA polymerase III subunit alpha, partial [Proteobacteria bacterium]|nr:DNA polymerase III subunit alpha [Pseudomonadota bacterium]